MRIIVTGGAGFIGSHFAERLLTAGHEVLALDNFDLTYPREYKERNLEPARGYESYRFVEGDIRDAPLVRGLFREWRPDALVHLAAKAGVRASLADPIGYLDVNLVGTLTLLEAARDHGVHKVLFASSSSVYGANENLPFSEADRVDRPVSVYAMTKKAGEELCFTFHHLHGLDIVALRFFTVYGPRGRPEMAMHKFAHLIAQGEPIPVFGEGRMQRDFTYIDDIVDGCEAALGHLWAESCAFEVFNLAAGRTVALDDMIAILENRLGKRAVRRLLPMQPGDVRRTAGDIGKARERLRYDPKVDIETGIDRFVDWYRREILTLPPDRRATVLAH
jgi:UDP-glucuronate 4-epimerase